MPSSEPRFLIIGQVIRPHGIRGELRLRVLTNYPERLPHLEHVFLSLKPEPEDGEVIYAVEHARLHHDQAILKLVALDDRTTAEHFREQYVMISLADAVPLEEGEYYHYQLIGLTMVTQAGQTLGQVTDILETGANEVYIVNSPQYGEILIPAIESVIQTIDLATQKITITPLPGLLPDDAENDA